MESKLASKKDCIYVGIRNVQGLKTKYDEISKELEGNNLDIAMLTETKEIIYRK
jgi:hypothetical protein